MWKIIAFSAIVACVHAEQQAIVILKAEGIDGQVVFTQKEGEVIVEGTITGIAEGKHGFHVHEKGDLSNGCTSAGGHFNPENKTHGAPTDTVRHVGDLGNIVANASKIATISIKDKQISLTGAHSIIGRAIVLHADEDDLGKGGYNDSLTTGHAGARLACGIIGILSDSSNYQTASSTLLLLSLIFTVFNYN